MKRYHVQIFKRPGKLCHYYIEIKTHEAQSKITALEYSYTYLGARYIAWREIRKCKRDSSEPKLVYEAYVPPLESNYEI